MNFLAGLCNILGNRDIKKISNTVYINVLAYKREQYHHITWGWQL